MNAYLAIRTRHELIAVMEAVHEYIDSMRKKAYEVDREDYDECNEKLMAAEALRDRIEDILASSS